MRIPKSLIIVIAIMIITVLSGCAESTFSETANFTQGEENVKQEAPTDLVIQYSGGVVVHYWLSADFYLGASGASWRVPGESSYHKSLGEITIVPLNGKAIENVLAEYGLN